MSTLIYKAYEPHSQLYVSYEPQLRTIIISTEYEIL